MISKSTIKLIKSLAVKKYRQKEQLFLVEGDKNILEVLDSAYIVKLLIATEDFVLNHEKEITRAEKIIPAEPAEIKKASLLKTPQNCLAVCHLQQGTRLPENLKGISLFLDGIRDPGNLGTIIRTCDWFGIKQIFCSPDTVDLYNPKVIQATMGSFCRVSLTYTEIQPLAELAKKSAIPILGTFMEGKNIYTELLPAKALIIAGNEGKGIRKNAEQYVTRKISIPRFADKIQKAESLNVAVAAAVVCSEFQRQANFR